MVTAVAVVTLVLVTEAGAEVATMAVTTTATDITEVGPIISYYIRSTSLSLHKIMCYLVRHRS